MMSLDELLSHFPGLRKPNGEGGYMVICPTGHDKIPSLSITPRDGKSGPRFHCFGCGTDRKEILEAAGLTLAAVLPDREEPVRRASVQAEEPFPVSGKVTKYDIKSPAGELVAIHAREDFDPDTGKEKRVWWEAPCGTPGLGGLKVNELPLYGIERVNGATGNSPVIIVEGEKPADALHHNGILAVGTVTGANSTPGDESFRPLLSRTVFLWRDNDDPGREHMDRIASVLLRLGHGDVRLIEWGKAPEKGDAADLFLMDGARDELDGLLDEARRMNPPPLFESLQTLLQKPTRPRWMVKNLIETPSTNCFFGPSGAGKTFVASDLAAAAAVNGEWYGKAVVAPGPVFYLAYEGRAGLLRRFQAWQLKNEVTIPAPRLYISTVRVGLNKDGGIKVENEIDRITKGAGVPPSLIVMDTLNRAMPDGDSENDTEDMTAFVNTVDAMRDRFGCVTVIVHHTGHKEQERSRGSTALKAAMDGELRIQKKGGIRVAEWTKLKDLPDEPQPQEFILETVLLDSAVDAGIVSEESEGELITSAVVSWQGKATRTAKPLTRAQNLGMETLRAAIEANEGLPVHLEGWRPLFYAKHSGDSPDAKRAAFMRTRQSLTGNNLVSVEHDKYSLL